MKAGLSWAAMVTVSPDISAPRAVNPIAIRAAHTASLFIVDGHPMNHLPTSWAEREGLNARIRASDWATSARVVSMD